MQRVLKMCVITVCLFNLCGCSGKEKVQTGKIVTCRYCGTEISNTVQVIELSSSKDAKKYGIKKESGCCVSCGNVQIMYSVSYKCEKCGNLYTKYKEKGSRKSVTGNIVKTKGICQQCNPTDTVEISVRCIQCRKEHRKYNDPDTTKPRVVYEGYCSAKCEKLSPKDPTSQ